MATVEQRDKRIATKQGQLEKAAPKLTVLNEKLAAFDEKARIAREKLAARQTRVDARVRRLTGEIEWLKAMPITGVADPTLDGDEPEGDDEGDEPTDESTDNAADVPESDESREHALARGQGGKFVRADANA